MEYVGIHTQQSRNNAKSMLLLVLFPVLVLVLTLVFFFILFQMGMDGEYQYDYSAGELAWSAFLGAMPWVLGAVLLWFGIAYFANTSIIRKATGARPLDRKENKRVYNLVENLCMSQGMPMPKVNVIRDSSLNAYASGINKGTYTVTLTTGIIEKLDDQELEAVIAHELSHIRNHDVHLLITSIVFVGIFAMIAQISLRMMRHMPRGNGKKGSGVIVILLIAALLAGLGYLFSSMMRFAISRKREYLADAGAAEMTKQPAALASALRKISADPRVEAVSRDDVAQLFIEHPLDKKKSKGFSSLFATHPPIDKRIEVLEQF